jgi:hypothetical protein
MQYLPQKPPGVDNYSLFFELGNLAYNLTMGEG